MIGTAMCACDKDVNFAATVWANHPFSNFNFRFLIEGSCDSSDSAFVLFAQFAHYC